LSEFFSDGDSLTRLWRDFITERTMIEDIGIKRRTLLGGTAALGALAVTSAGRAEQSPTFRLTEVASFEHQVTGVAASKEGRVFVNFPRWTEDNAVSVAEVRPDGTLKPYPDETWNGWRNARATMLSPAKYFVCVQSVVADERGNLWVLDPAAPGNERVLAGGPKLVQIDLASNKVAKVIPFGEDVALQGSYLNDVRIHPDGRTAYITDSGARGAIVVVDLTTGRAHSVLDGHLSTQADKSAEITIDGKKLVRPDGRGFVVNADSIALSRDGATLYWQALTGRTLYSIATEELTNSNDPAALGARVVEVGTTNVADGMLMTRDGKLYLTAPEDNAVKLWNGKKSETVLSDTRLRWPDSMAEAPDGSIYVTASHIPDMPWFRPGAPIAVPTQLFKMARG
jgi:sugar lactone lactonase YvrE